MITDSDKQIIEDASNPKITRELIESLGWRIVYSDPTELTFVHDVFGGYHGFNLLVDKKTDKKTSDIEIACHFSVQLGLIGLEAHPVFRWYDGSYHYAKRIHRLNELEQLTEHLLQEINKYKISEYKTYPAKS